MEMPQIELVIINKLGLHARPASLFVRVAQKFEAEIFVSLKKKPNYEVNAKSVMGVMTLGAASGTAITVRAEGLDAERALRSLQLLVEKRFLEDYRKKTNRRKTSVK
jgi:phosphocarrier protein